VTEQLIEQHQVAIRSDIATTALGDLRLKEIVILANSVSLHIKCSFFI